MSEHTIETLNDTYRLVSMSVCSQTGEIPEATVTVVVAGSEKTAVARGSGPVDATFRAIEKIVNSASTLQLYSVNNITSGTDSQGEVTVRVEKDGQIINGHGADTDIVIASGRAYINAMNKLADNAGRSHPQQTHLL